MAEPGISGRENLAGALRKAAGEGNLNEADRLADLLCSSHGQEESLGYIYLAQRDLMNRNPAQAAERLIAIVDRFPLQADIPFLIARAYGDQYRHGRAEPYLKRVVELAPDSGPGNYALGRNLFKAGRSTEATPYLRKAATIQPTAEAALLLARALVGQDDMAEAGEWIDKALALAPDNAEIKAEHAEIKQAGMGAPSRSRFVRWPESVNDFADMKQLMREQILKGYDTHGFVLRPGMGVVTQGSCFAGNLANSFRRYPLKVANIPFGEEHNSTYANLAVARWLAAGEVDDMTAIVAETMGAGNRDQYVAALRSADLFVYTLGVAPAFFDRETGEFRMPRNTAASKASLIRSADFRTTTVEENVVNVTQILEILRDFNPNCLVVLSLSPVPLASTSEFASAIIADCVSKSTLRVAAHQLTQNRALKALYWPSFEVARWASGHHGRVYGNDDGSSHHLDFKVIDDIIDNFIHLFASPELKAAGPQA